LQIRVEYLGRRVVCQHCQGHLIAADSTNAHCDHAELGNALLRRADELLETISQRRPQPR
jgi:hypothetical protein